MGERTRLVLERWSDLGVPVVLCTARPLRWVRPLARELGDPPLAACDNGAVMWDLAADRLIAARVLGSDDALAVVGRVQEALPGGAWAVERVDGFAHEPDYQPHWPVAPETAVAPVAQLLEQPPVKLMYRRPGLAADAMLPAARVAAGEQAEVTHSNSRGDLLELSRPGVSKGAALAELCAQRGISAAEVVAFGDMPNDLSMLHWAGRAVAVAGAHPDVLAVADEITLGNNEEGVAVTLERMLTHASGWLSS